MASGKRPLLHTPNKDIRSGAIIKYAAKWLEAAVFHNIPSRKGHRHCKLRCHTCITSGQNLEKLGKDFKQKNRECQAWAKPFVIAVCNAETETVLKTLMRSMESTRALHRGTQDWEFLYLLEAEIHRHLGKLPQRMNKWKSAKRKIENRNFDLSEI